MGASIVGAIRAHVEKSQARRQVAFAAGMQRAQVDEVFRLICALYWGEGSKRGTAFAFVNSDIRMMLLVARWLSKEETTGHRSLIVTYHAQPGCTGNTVAKAWIDVVHAVRGAFKVIRIEGKGNFLKRRLLNGTGSLRVNSVDLLYEVLGGIEYLCGELAETV